MAQRKLAETIREVAQIVVYVQGFPTPMMTRYHDMGEAKKQFDGLMKAADKGKPYVLSSPASTVVFRYASSIVAAYLVNVETNNFLMVDSQKRMNAMAQMP